MRCRRFNRILDGRLKTTDAKDLLDTLKYTDTHTHIYIVHRGWARNHPCSDICVYNVSKYSMASIITPISSSANEYNQVKFHVVADIFRMRILTRV